MRERVVVVGAGVYGCAVALELSRYYRQVDLVEMAGTLMSRASYNNQARIHRGYHYPRSLKTGLSCRKNYQLFRDEFPDSVSHGIDTFYAIAKKRSLISHREFEEFCQRIQAPLSEVSQDAYENFISDEISRLYRVNEDAFNIDVLKAEYQRRLERSSVQVKLNTKAVRISNKAKRYQLRLQNESEQYCIDTDSVYICTYSNINNLLTGSGIKPVSLYHELAEMVLLDTSRVTQDIAITVMDGPFFSLFPFPARGFKTLSHVAYTPHLSWLDDGRGKYPDTDQVLGKKPRSNQRRMILDAARYMPELRNARYLESLWEIKTTLPSSEMNDGRPVLFRECARSVYALLGSKINNIYDLKAEIKSRYQDSAYA